MNICPGCHKEITYASDEIFFIHGQHVIQTLCPVCGYMLEEKPTRFGLGWRIVFLIIIIPVAMFTQILLMALAYHFSTNFDFNILSFIVITIYVVVCFYLFFRWQRNRQKRLAKITLPAPVQPVAAENKEPLPSDPRMAKIYQDAMTVIRNKKPAQEKKLKVARRAYLVAVILIVTIYAGYKEYPLIKNTFIQDTSMKQELIQQRGEEIVRSLEEDYSMNKVYPENLANSIIVANERLHETLNGEFERKYFGKTLRLSEFTYRTDGQQYELCYPAKDKALYKCWQNIKH